LEIGPLDVNLQPRNVTWINAANVLFVDNPVGTGYSYVDDESAFTTNNTQIGLDLVALLKGFLDKHSEFVQVPLYIFSESYGGKMTAGFGKALNDALKAGSISCSFQGVALGDSWISPESFTSTWGPFLKTMSLVDEDGLDALNADAKKISDLIASGSFEDATNAWGDMENDVEFLTNNVNFYNILTLDSEGAATTLAKKSPKLSATERLMARHLFRLQDNQLSTIMNGPIRSKLKIIPSNVTWGAQASKVFQMLAGDFMRPVVDTVDELLAAGTKVIVYNGQLDLICDTPGTEAWVNTLKWSGLSSWKKAPRLPMYPDSSTSLTGAFVKSYENFSFYYIMRAGHMVPADQPDMAYVFLKTATRIS